jgi:hypothetical protein
MVNGLVVRIEGGGRSALDVPVWADVRLLHRLSLIDSLYRRVGSYV